MIPPLKQKRKVKPVAIKVSSQFYTTCKSRSEPTPKAFDFKSQVFSSGYSLGKICLFNEEGWINLSVLMKIS